MAIWLAIILGLVQGLTEFLPVSSSGHLLMFQKWFGLSADMLMFNIVLHLATLAAVVVVFRKKIWQLIKKPLNKTNLYLLIATAITCTMVVLFKNWVDALMTHRILPITFLITAILLILATFIKPRNTQSAKLPILTGLAQGIAVIPGISRSGATITAALAAGTSREKAAEFSFLMSIPIILASFVYELISNTSGLSTLSPLPLIFGFIAAMAAGIFAIKFMLRIVKNVKLYWFSIYLAILAILLIFI
jgi:undecaprenyl-diphosphatase